ncbi:MAG: DUF7689 domain-containing protein [Dehalococcoidia bacterium]
MTQGQSGAWLTPRLRIQLPNLDLATCSETSRRDGNYNCIAWAAGQQDRWFWPDQDSYWPDGLTPAETVEAFIELFESLGYEACEGPDREENYDKIVIYVKDGKPTHAARQLPDGGWTSKLGELEDIAHESLRNLAGPIYGAPHTSMKRRRAG